MYNNIENCILLSEMHPGRCRHIVGNATNIFGFEWSRLVFIHNNAFFVLKICIPIDLGGLKNNIPNFHPTTILMFAAPFFELWRHGIKRRDRQGIYPRKCFCCVVCLANTRRMKRIGRRRAGMLLSWNFWLTEATKYAPSHYSPFK